MNTMSRKIKDWIIPILFCLSFADAHAQNYFWKIVDKEFDSIAAILDKDTDISDKMGKELLKELESISIKKNMAILNIRYRYWNAFLNEDNFRNTTDKNSRTSYIIETLSYLDTIEYDYDYARIKFLLLGDPNESSNYLEQYKQLYEILPIFKKFNDLIYEGNCYRYLGILFAQISQYEQAISYLDKADECYRKLENKSSLASNATNRAVLLYYMGKPDASTQLFQELLKDTIIQKRPRTLISIYINLTLSSASEKQKTEYEDSVMSLLKRYPEAVGNEYVYSFLINRAHHFLQKNEYDSAIHLYQKVLKESAEENLQNVTLNTLFGLSQCYAGKGDYQKGYNYLISFQNIQDSIKGIRSKINEINHAETSTAIMEYQNRLSIQEQKIALQKRLTVLITISITLLAVILLIILIYLRQKKKLAETTVLNKELHNQKLQQEIDYQNRELSSTLLILSENRNFLQQILVQLEKAKSKGNINGSCEQELRKMITNYIQSEDEWEAFKIHFEKVHPDFFNKLRNRHENLTTNDLKLCAYIRIGLNIKQISHMTSVLPATIKTNRYLLRRKMNLDENTPLDKYISSI